MKLHGSDRARIRKKQDKLIRLASQRGHALDSPVSADLPPAVTLERIKMILFPEYEHVFDRIIGNLE